MNLDAGSILVIIGSVVASAGVIGRSRLERWVDGVLTRKKGLGF